MYKIIIYLNMILISLIGWKVSEKETEIVSTEITMCHTGPSEMIAFLDDPKFVAFHPAPIPFDFDPLGEMTTFPTADGKKANGYLIKAKKTYRQLAFCLSGMVGSQ